VLQEAVGERHADRFYPHLSGVARSWSGYPVGKARPEDGVVDLALGLGSYIVDGGRAWSYPPGHPRMTPPFAGPSEMLRGTQLAFQAINMGKLELYDPTREAEFIVENDLSKAEADGTLRWLASTYDGRSDRLVPGVGIEGPRVLDFAPLLKLKTWGLDEAVRTLLTTCEERLGVEVEIEFAAVFPERGDAPARLGFLQVRPLVVSEEGAEVSDDELRAEGALVASSRALGSGVLEGIRDIVYVRPEHFEARLTRRVASELEEINQRLVDEGHDCLLIGFGRWGSSDPWLGIPVTWPQICAARAIVEATLPSMNVEASQGSHFFHNISSLGIPYVTVRHDEADRIDWEGLERLPAVSSSELVRHVRLDAPLSVRVDGRRRRAVVHP
jgi:hypothetical protein